MTTTTRVEGDVAINSTGRGTANSRGICVVPWQDLRRIASMTFRNPYDFAWCFILPKLVLCRKVFLESIVIRRDTCRSLLARASACYSKHTLLWCTLGVPQSLGGLHRDGGQAFVRFISGRQGSLQRTKPNPFVTPRYDT